MSRRPPAQNTERTTQNQQTLKTLVKVESNKSCADCKRNKHPRWASWNLGVFICIRCSGIHRGMGTHISRVKSVDLDAWTDEQMQSILKWGNARANKYWEAKLQPGHVPAENKIENFIRTKYESKRWVMDGPMPDPSTLDTDGDDEVPLNVVQEKAKLDRSSSTRTSSAPIAAPGTIPAPRAPAQQINLFDDDPPAPRPASVATPGARQPPPPQQTTTQAAKQPSKAGGDSLLGFDFFGPSSTSTNPPPRPNSAAASTPGISAGPSRPDLKQSILSLYAAKPSPPQPQEQQHNRTGSGSSAQAGNSAGLGDAFASLSFSSQSPPQSAPQPAPSPFADLTSPQSPPVRSRPSIGTGNFFNQSKPTPANPPPIQSQPSRPQRTPSSSDGFGDFTSATPTSSMKSPPAPPATTATNSLAADLLDFSTPTPSPAPLPTPAPQPAAPKNPPPIQNPAFDSSPFNLSAPKPTTQMQPQAAVQKSKPVAAPGGLEDPWGSSDIWATNATSAPAPVAAPAPTPAMKTPTAAPSMSDDFGGWASATPTAATATAGPPKVTADEEFGGWESRSGATPTAQTAPKPSGSGFGGADDLFSNVWE